MKPYKKNEGSANQGDITALEANKELVEAVMRGSARSAELWIEAGGDANAFKNGFPLLVQAVYVAGEDVLLTLIKAGANLNARDENIGMTALMYAIAAGDSDKARILIEAKADIEAADNNGRTPLMLAASHHTPFSRDMLMDAGADLAVQDNNGKTADDYARLFCISPTSSQKKRTPR